MLYKYSLDGELLLQIELDFGVREVKFLSTGLIVTGSGGQLAFLDKVGNIQW